jgi:hypothetical protein
MTRRSDTTMLPLPAWARALEPTFTSVMQEPGIPATVRMAMHVLWRYGHLTSVAAICAAAGWSERATTCRWQRTGICSPKQALTDLRLAFVLAGKRAGIPHASIAVLLNYSSPQGLARHVRVATDMRLDQLAALCSPEQMLAQLAQRLQPGHGRRPAFRCPACGHSIRGQTVPGQEIAA